MLFDSYSWSKAAKQYRCEWCGETILFGEVHAKFVGSFKGEFQNWRMHQECQEAWENMPSDYKEDGFSSYDNERPLVTLAEFYSPHKQKQPCSLCKIERYSPTLLVRLPSCH